MAKGFRLIGGDVFAGIIRKIQGITPSAFFLTLVDDADASAARTTLGVDASGSATVANDSITNAKLDNMAQSTIKGREAGGGTGDPQDLTATQATAILNNMVGDSGSGGTKGLVPAPSAGDAAAGKFLKADGTWATSAFSGTFGDGSAGSPSWSFTSDAALGAYRADDDTMGFTAGGTGRMSVSPTGAYIGGTERFPDAQLHVISSAGNFPALRIVSGDTPSADVVQVREKVGVNQWTRVFVDSSLNLIVQSRAASQTVTGTVTEETTLSTSGATTDTSIDLPANSIIEAVTTRIISTINGIDSTTLQVGDPTTATRFGTTSTLTLNATAVHMDQMKGGISTDAAGPVQVSTAKVRLTLTGGGDNTPSSGQVRVTIHYRKFVAPTS